MSLSPSNASNIAKKTTTVGLFAALEKMYKKPSASNKGHLRKKLFNLKMADDAIVVEHMNDFNTITI